MATDGTIGVASVPVAREAGRARSGVSVVVTVYNERGTLAELYGRTVAARRTGGRSSSLFVDDGSTDGTFDGARSGCTTRDPRVHAVRFKRNFGQHPAMHAGFARARGDVIVTMDGDLQNQPEDIPKLVAAVEAAPTSRAAGAARAATRGAGRCRRG